MKKICSILIEHKNNHLSFQNERFFVFIIIYLSTEMPIHTNIIKY